MNLSFEEILIIAVIALVVIGPHRLPEYAEQLGKLVRNVRQMATGATQSIRDELGDEMADLDFSKFDPRQYDPRRIVREALLEDIVPATKPARAKTTTRPPITRADKGGRATASSATAATAAATATATAAAVTSTEDAVVAEPGDTATAATADATGAETVSAVVGASDLPPFDDEAT